ncbi:phosphatase 2C-like domain-containing protein [Globomyces pollinis-pini]|nr:phosphatase 2C-like domain-containing protein [Globomyces pollinis-pini]
MGQTLSEPVTEKHTSFGKDHKISWAASEMQGWRITMEDAHTTILNMLDKPDDHLAFFAVFDGHGGAAAAKYAGLNLHENIIQSKEFKEKQYKEALRVAFLKTDENLRSDPNFLEASGCTAVATLITDDDQILCANAGDSRAVLCNGGTAVPLSFDHKPSNAMEYNRIIAGGGFVEFGRVNGNLALSRAIGDFEFKSNLQLPPEQQVVTCNPEITVREAHPDDEFFVVACDGIWDCMTNQQVCDFVCQRIAQGQSLSQICEAMTDNCLAKEAMAGLGCDNMTVVICAILKGQSEEEWKNKISKRVGVQGEVVPLDGVN